MIPIVPVVDSVYILGVRVDLISFSRTLGLAEDFIRSKKKLFIVTPYSESIVSASKDPEYKKVVNSASLSVPDGGSLLAAAEFLNLTLPKNQPLRLAAALAGGLRVGLKLAFLRSRFRFLKEPVRGVDLLDSFCRLAARENLRVFLLGGGFVSDFYRVTASGRPQKDVPRLSVAAVAKEVLLKRYNNLCIETDSGPEDLSKSVGTETERVIRKINEYKPDFLFVAFKPVVQEKWLYRNLEMIDATVFMAVGGAFDMISGLRRRAPRLFCQFNLEWLWRLLIEPSRIRRIYKAIIVFPWLVFKEKLRGA